MNSHTGGDGGFINPSMLENKVYFKNLIANRRFYLENPADRRYWKIH